MRVFTRWIKLPLDVSVQRSQHADARHHRRAVEFNDEKQGFNRGLPFLEQLLSLRQAGDVIAGIAQSHELTPTRQQDRIIERTGPGGSELRSCDQLSAFRDGLSAQVAFFSAA
jgi:hypothetical protein